MGWLEPQVSRQVSLVSRRLRQLRGRYAVTTVVLLVASPALVLSAWELAECACCSSPVALAHLAPTSGPP